MLIRAHALRALAALFFLLTANQAIAQSTEFVRDFVQINVLLDLDNELGTGCQQATVDGTFEGVDQRVEIRLRPDYTPFPSSAENLLTEISSVNLLNCAQDGTTSFADPVALPLEGTPISEGTGSEGAAVIELAIPTEALAPQVRIGAQIGLADAMFRLSNPPGVHDALLTTDGAPDSGVILIGEAETDDNPSPGPSPAPAPGPEKGGEPVPVPALGIIATVVLVALMAGLLVLSRRRLRAGSKTLVMLVVVLSGVALAAVWTTSTIVADGLQDRPVMQPAATDPTNWQGVPAPDLIALFGTVEGDGTITLRIEALLPESCAGQEGTIFCRDLDFGGCDALPDGCPLSVEDEIFAAGYAANSFSCVDDLPGVLPRCTWSNGQPGFLTSRLATNREERSCTTLNDGTRVIGTYLGDPADVDIDASNANCNQQFRNWESAGCPLLFDSLLGPPLAESLCGRVIRGAPARDFSCSPEAFCVIETNYCEPRINATEQCCNNVGNVCNGGCGNTTGCRTTVIGDLLDGLQLDDLACSADGTAAESLCEGLN